MVEYGLVEDRARRIAKAGGEKQSAKIVERAEMGRCLREQREIVLLGLLKRSLFPEETGALETRLYRIRIILYRPIELLNAVDSRV